MVPLIKMLTVYSSGAERTRTEVIATSVSGIKLTPEKIADLQERMRVIDEELSASKGQRFEASGR